MLIPMGCTASLKSHRGFTESHGAFVIAADGEDDGAPAASYALIVATTNNGTDAGFSEILQITRPLRSAAKVVVTAQPANMLDPVDQKTKKSGRAVKRSYVRQRSNSRRAPSEKDRKDLGFNAKCGCRSS